MGRRPYSNRLMGEECPSFSTKVLKQFGTGNHVSGNCNWVNTQGDELCRVYFFISTNWGDEHIRFSYTLTDEKTKEEFDFDYRVRLESTPCNWGGKRWWFLCPLAAEGRACGRRVGVLYLGGQQYFGCRHCYNLTYQTCQDSHKKAQKR